MYLCKPFTPFSRYRQSEGVDRRADDEASASPGEEAADPWAARPGFRREQATTGNEPLEPETTGYEPSGPKTTGFEPSGPQKTSYESSGPKTPGYDPSGPRTTGYEP